MAGKKRGPNRVNDFVSIQEQTLGSPVIYPIFQTNFVDDMGSKKPTYINDVGAEGAAPTTEEWSSWGDNPYQANVPKQPSK